MSRYCSVSYFSLVNNRTIVVLPSDCIFVDGRIECCGICSITRYCNNFRSPTCECVRILSSCRFGRSRTIICRNYTILNFCTLQYFTTIHECDCIFVDSRIEYSVISRISCYCSKFRIPTCKRVSILCVSLFCRCGSVICRNYSIFNFCALQYLITILKRNGVFVNSRIIGGSICCITCYSNDFWYPTCKGVCILCCCRFTWICMSWQSTILHFSLINNRTIIVLPSDCIFVDGRIECRGIGCVTYYRNHFWGPTCKSVGILRRCRFGRSRTIICRNYTILNFCALQYFTTVHKRNGVFVNRRIKCCRVCCVLCCSYYFGIPSSESISVLRVCFFCRDSSIICRYYTMFDF